MPINAQQTAAASVEVRKGQSVCPNGGAVYQIGKRMFDIVCSLAALLVLAIPMLILCLFIFIDDPHACPVFKQERVGKDGRIFRFYKLRSMYSDAEARLEELLDKNEMTGPAFKMKADPRITRIGRFIRKTSIDELPQLMNVLLGDMSIVGPRPPLPREVAQYTDYQKQRLCVTPGLTCFWQIQDRRNDLTFDQWVELDLRYIRERSFLLDLKLIFLTVRAMFTMQGI